MIYQGGAPQQYPNGLPLNQQIPAFGQGMPQPGQQFPMGQQAQPIFVQQN